MYSLPAFHLAMVTRTFAKEIFEIPSRFTFWILQQCVQRLAMLLQRHKKEEEEEEEEEEKDKMRLGKLKYYAKFIMFSIPAQQ